MVILITGKSGAGKSHYALEYIREKKMVEESSRPTIAWIDGDMFRAELDNQDYTDEGREKNLRNAAKRAAKLEQQGMVVVCSFIAPLKKWRDMMREYWQESLVVYIPGGSMWKGTVYENPDIDELMIRKN